MPRRFDFISPGIQLTEIDQSTIPAESAGDGPLIVGLASRGPANKPVRITSKDYFNTVFGEPVYGAVSNNPDSWRNGSRVFPHYGSIAADAWLSADESPITFIRLLGEDKPNVADAGKAGWITSKTNSSVTSSNGGAYGLFVINSGSAGALSATGTLAAVWYLEQGKIELSGTNSNGAAEQGAGVLIESIGARQFKAVISNGAVTSTETITFSLNESDGDYIRNVFNTEAYETNGTITDSTKTYWLGETYEESVDRRVSNTSAGQYGIILGLGSGSSYWADHRDSFLPSKTGWFINRDPNADFASFDSSNTDSAEKLFRLVSLHDGEEFEKNYYVRISNLNLGRVEDPNSTFTVEIVSWESGVAIETFSNLNLNPASSDFIGRRIGTQYLAWDPTDKKFNVKGLYENLSDYVYVELAERLENGAGPSDSFAIPFGYYGPNKFKGFSIVSGAADTKSFDTLTAFNDAYVLGRGEIPATINAGQFASLYQVTSASFEFPDIKLTISGANNNSTDFNVDQNTVFGLWPRLSAQNSRDNSYVDLVRALPTGYDVHGDASGNVVKSFIFTLDEIIYSEDDETAYYSAGSRATGASYTAKSGSSGLLDLNFKGFSAPFFGGKDGLEIKEKDPFREGIIGTTKNNSYEYFTLQKVLDIARDPENVSMDIFSIPGLRDDETLDDIIAVADSRQDCLAIIDPSDGYTTAGDSKNPAAGTVANVISGVKGRRYNSSYGAAYHPWVLLDNPVGPAIYAPPSVAAIGAIASSQKATAPWFAPAGFNRGGLSNLGGSNGPAVLGVAETLNKSNRDKLYQISVNPIANFGGNPVIFGQKTLQATPSALDRINVRRLMIYVKKQIGTVAETVLFDQNINLTWRRFSDAAKAILNDVQAGGGITEYKLILDETTTTPDLQDRNILYAKVMIKPARAIEFIAVDFVLTRSGVQF